MNYSLIFKLLGSVLKYEALFMVPCIIVSYIYGGEDAFGFIVTMFLCLATGMFLSIFTPKEKKFRTKEGFFAVAMCWVVLSVFGAIPFHLSGYFNSFIDCLFESISGFTTSGATVLTDIESFPKGIVFWRGFTHWIGGMGVIVFMLAIMPSMSASSVNLLKAESTGPSPTKFVPNIRSTAIIMYEIYFVMSLAQVILLMLVGLNLFDAVVQTFSSAGTGGFSSRNLSIASFNNPLAETIITVFLFLFGINFTLYFYVLRRDFKSFYKDEEFIVYSALILFCIVTIAINISHLHPSALEAVRFSSFQVVSVITSTGFSTTDFNLWPVFSKSLLLLLMVAGSCAGSTSGGIKIVRILIIFKAIRIEINKIIHPRIVKTLRVNGKKVEDTAVSQVFMFMSLYTIIFIVSTILVSLENRDLITTITAVVSSLGNTGMGLGEIGPGGSYGIFNPFSKIVLSFCMLAGRLEFFPVLVLFIPSIWKKGSLS